MHAANTNAVVEVFAWPTQVPKMDTFVAAKSEQRVDIASKVRAQHRAPLSMVLYLIYLLTLH